MTDPVEKLRLLTLNSLLKGGGADDQCVKLVHGLRQLGAEATLAGPADREYSRVARSLGVPLHATPPEGPLKLRFIWAVAREARRQKVHILHGHQGRDLWPTILAARLSGVRPRIVLTRHMAKSPSSWPSRHFLLSQCDALIAVSQFVAHVLREGDRDPGSPNPERHHRPPLRGDLSKIHVIYGGIDAGRFNVRPGSDTAVARLRQEWGLKEGCRAFAIIGSMDFPRGKGQREFLQAAARITAQAPQARFLLIGRGNMESLLREDIARLGLQDVARLTGHCQDMPAVMNAIDCMVHSQVGTEALPGVVLEAHACGRPVIASDLDGIPEAFAAGGLGRLVRPESVEELAGAMLTEAKQGPLSETERHLCHDRVARSFSLERSARAHLEFLGGLIPARNMADRPARFTAKAKSRESP